MLNRNMIKALFFDIDGTLVSFRTHRIPKATVQALTCAKNKGVEIYISTGRPYPLINNINEIEHLIDGYITANGSYCFCGNKIISCSPISPEDVRSVIRKADEMNFACMIVGEEDLTMYNSNTKVDRIFKEMLDVSDLGEDVSLEKVLKQRILQLTPVITEQEEREILPLLERVMSSRWCPDFADITAKGVSKAKGLNEIVHWRGFDLSQTMAFGDGGNDIAIVKEAGIGVAMGNANDSLKEVADYVTSSVDDDGIFNALKHFGVI